MARVEYNQHATQISGVNNPAKQVSKDPWNDNAHTQQGVIGYDEPSETVLSSGVASPTDTQGLIVIGAESGTVDDFVTLTATNYAENDVVRLKSTTGDTITIKSGDGNLVGKNARDVVLSDTKETIVRYDGTNFNEILSTDILIIGGVAQEVLDY